MFETLHRISSLPFYLLLHLQVCLHLFSCASDINMFSCQNKMLKQEKPPLRSLMYCRRGTPTFTFVLPDSKEYENINLTHPTDELPRCKITLTGTTLTCCLHSVNSFVIFFLGYDQKHVAKDGSLLISKLPYLTSCQLMQGDSFVVGLSL